MGDVMKRREFIRTATAGAAAYSLLPSALWAGDTFPQVVWVENGTPGQLLDTALQNLGGINRFISSGDVVVVKPNIGWDRSPEQAANTNPQLVSAVISACLKAGAKQVKVFDRTCNEKNRCYRNSEIEKAAYEAGAEVTHIRENKFHPLKLDGRILKEWLVYEEYLEADKVINLPIAKHHGLSKVTLGLKNLMGVMGGNRGSLHNQFPQKMADINSHIKPTLTIIDGYRILTENGPQGGSLNYVQMPKALVASDCIVSADWVALSLFGLKPSDVEYIRVAAERGLARYDTANLQVKRIKL